jgi:hypothetical protein
MTEHLPRYRNNRPGRVILFTAGILMGATLLLVWSWNTLAVDFFTMPTAQFKHALAFELFLLGMFLIHHTSKRLLTLDRAHRNRIGRSSHGTA